MVKVKEALQEGERLITILYLVIELYGGPEGQSLRVKSQVVLRVNSQVEVLSPQGQVSGRRP